MLHQLVVEQVALVERDQPGLLFQPRAVIFQLAIDDAHRLDRIVAVRVDQMDQHLAALDMAEEAVADACAFRRALDQPGNIGEHEFAVAVPHHAQLRAQRRERIVAHLGMRIGHLVDKGGLARIGQADQPRIGHQLQPQPYPHFLARPARPVLTRGAVGAGGIAQVPAPAIAAAQQRDTLARMGEIGEHVLLVLGQDLRAHRHLDHQIVAARAGAVAAHAAGAALRLEMLGIAKVDQRIEAADRFEDDVATLAAIAAIGAAIFDIFFAAEGHRALSAGTRANENLGLIEKMHGRAPNGKRRETPE